MSTSRLLTLALLCSLFLGPVAFAISASPADREAAIQAINDALERANSGQRSVDDAHVLRASGQAKLHAAAKEIKSIMQQKSEVRKNIADLKKLAASFEDTYGINPTESGAVVIAIEKEEERINDFVQRYVRILLRREFRKAKYGNSLFERLVGTTYGQMVMDELYERALKRARLEFLMALASVQDLAQQMADLEKRHQELLAAYQAEQGNYDIGNQEIALSAAKLQEIKNIVAAVDRQVAQLSLELAHYDQLLRKDAAQELVKMGLPVPASLTNATPTFVWPVYGAITAGFYEASYKRYFGVPHKAIDIRQGQGSPVRASADGIVYHVQHGGAYGYSYILIGHRGGYATLYGHMYDIYVAPGQKISQGVTIGLSGGRPGTRGAGPMTTGPHLHFEVIKDGKHINPVTVLP